jgi:hypothetical protein
MAQDPAALSGIEMFAKILYVTQRMPRHLQAAFVEYIYGELLFERPADLDSELARFMQAIDYHKTQ